MVSAAVVAVVVNALNAVSASKAPRRVPKGAANVVRSAAAVLTRGHVVSPPGLRRPAPWAKRPRAQRKPVKTCKVATFRHQKVVRSAHEAGSGVRVATVASAPNRANA